MRVEFLEAWENASLDLMDMGLVLNWAHLTDPLGELDVFHLHWVSKTRENCHEINGSRGDAAVAACGSTRIGRIEVAA